MAVVGDQSTSAMQVIILGCGGGPHEHNTTAFLVRSLATCWAKGSVVAVDAGVHLSAIAAVLARDQPASLGLDAGPALPHRLQSGPFAGLELHNRNVAANAGHIVRQLVDTYLITHPHLDHISGFVINSAGLTGNRPKRLAALPSTIAAFKAHIFNNVIWPNLSDENNGVGLITYMRLVEGSSPALGDGDDRGYLEICKGLSVKAWSVSHGHCMTRTKHHGSASPSSIQYPDFAARRSLRPCASLSHHNHPLDNNNHQNRQLQHSQHNQPYLAYSQQQPRPKSLASLSVPPLEAVGAVRHSHLLGGITCLHRNSVSGCSIRSIGFNPSATSNSLAIADDPVAPSAPSNLPAERICVYDSSAYFIRDVATGREVLIFGDVEPDLISLSPRNHLVWREAAPKIAAGSLTALLIECSYDNSQAIDRLYGHLSPTFVIRELCTLASEVELAQNAANFLKIPPFHHHLRNSLEAVSPKTTGPPLIPINDDVDDGFALSAATHNPIHDHDGSHNGSHNESHNGKYKGIHNGIHLHNYSGMNNGTPRENGTKPALDTGNHIVSHTPPLSPPTVPQNHQQQQQPPPPHRVDQGLGAKKLDQQEGEAVKLPLRGLRVIIIHVKDKLSDEINSGDIIMHQLLEEEGGRLGCEFVLASVGQSIYV